MLVSLLGLPSEATIVRTQTTFLELAGATGMFRLHYRDKAEFSLQNGSHGVLAQFTEHPLLWDHNGPRTSVYAAGAAPDPPALVDALQRAVATASQQWRPLERYFFGSNPAGARALVTQNLTDGSGLLLQWAPVAIAQAVEEVCRRHGAATYTFPPPPPEAPVVAAPFTVLFLGTCFVIARDFKVQAL